MTKQVLLILLMEQDKVWLTLEVAAVEVITPPWVLIRNNKEVTVPVILHNLI